MADDDYLVFSHTSSIGNKPHCNAAHPTSWQQLLLLVLAFFAPWNWSIWAPAQRYTITKYISCHTCNGFAWPFKKGVDSCFKENIIMMWIFFPILLSVNNPGKARNSRFRLMWVPQCQICRHRERWGRMLSHCGISPLSNRTLSQKVKGIGKLVQLAWNNLSSCTDSN